MNPTNNPTEELYSDEAVSKKRAIIMDMLGAIISTGTNANLDVWKLHIDAALDQLDQTVYEPIIHQEATKAVLKELEDMWAHSMISYHQHGKDNCVPLEEVETKPFIPLKKRIATLKATLDKEGKEDE